MPSQRLAQQAIKLPPRYRLIKDNQRTLKCTHGKKNVPCLTRFRVKEIEPGVYNRTCPVCKQVSYFQLVLSGGEHEGLPLLRFHWLTKQEADSIESAFLATTVDIGICRNR